MIKSASQSSLTNDVKYRNLDTFNIPSSEYLIQTIIVGSTPLANITFENLSQYAGTYKHLQLVISARSNRGLDYDYLLFKLNNNVQTKGHSMIGEGGNVLGWEGTNPGIFTANSSPASAFGLQ